MSKLLIISTILILTTVSCKNSDNKVVDPSDKVIAQVGETKLYQSKIGSLYEADIEEDERDILIKGFVSNWIREQLMIDEAEKSIPNDVNIEDLIDEYRSSLILNYYEAKLVQELLDTLVSHEQKQTYYEESKTEFVLTEAIIKGIFFKIDKAASSKKLRSALKEENTDEIIKIVGRKLESEFVGPNKYLPLSDILTFLEDDYYTKSRIDGKGVHNRVIGNFEYFVKTIDFVDKNEIPPLEYIDSKITQIILNNRKKALIQRKKQQLYDQNYNNNKIKINLD